MDVVIFGTLTVGNALAFLAGGLGVSIIVQVLKKVFGLQSSKVVQFVVVAMSFAVTALDYIISVAHSNPAVLAGHAAAILGIANAAHTFIISDASAFVGKVRTALADEAANAPAAAAPTQATTIINNAPAPTPVPAPKPQLPVAGF